MARIAGIDIPNQKVVVYALTYVYGVGLYTAKKVCAEVNIDPTKRVKDLSEVELTALRNELAKSEYKIEGDLRRDTRLNIKRLMEIGCYRGIRHRKNLPCRGQHTKNNARTCKGPRKTVANKKAAGI